MGGMKGREEGRDVGWGEREEYTSKKDLNKVSIKMLKLDKEIAQLVRGKNR